MGDGKHDNWSGSDALHQLNGLSSDAFPVRAMFLAHRVAGSGRLWMTQGVNIRSIDFLNGAIVGCSGYTALLEDIDGERGWSLGDWVEAAKSMTDVPHEPAMRVAVAICREVIQAEDSGDWMVNFVGSGSEESASEFPSIDALVALQHAIRESVSELSVREWLEGAAGTGFASYAPTDCDAEQWKLDARTKGLFDAACKASSVGALFVAVGSDGWGDLGVLWRLGLLRLAAQSTSKDESKSPEVAEDLSADGSFGIENEMDATMQDASVGGAEPKGIPEAQPSGESLRPEANQTTSTADDRTEEGPSQATSTTQASADAGTSTADAAGPQPSGGNVFSSRRAAAAKASRSADPEKRPNRSKRDAKAGRKKRRRDPRLVAILRSPYENPAKMEVHLREAYDVLTRMRPEVLFRIKKSEDLDSEKIERRYLDSCSKYHPDRYRGASQGVQSLAEGCFTAVSDAYHTLQDETYMADLRIRIVEKETGQRVVTDKTRAAAKVEYAKADVLFKQKRYDAAFDLARRATEGDPDRWQYQYLKWRLAYRTGEADVDVVRDEIGRLTGMNSIEKAASLCAVGEMYMREGQEEKAYELFRQTLMLDGKNVGARRRMRLKDRREQDTNEREASGLFSGLFQRKKR